MEDKDFSLQKQVSKMTITFRGTLDPAPPAVVMLDELRKAKGATNMQSLII